MKAVAPQEALALVRAADLMSREEIAGLQRARLAELVAFAREHSAFYGEKYAGLPETPSLEELPPVTKQELTAPMRG